MLVSLVISTRGRTTPFTRLFQSLDAQTHQDFEVVIVDQNTDGSLDEFLSLQRRSFPLKYLATPGESGLSRGRNAGLAISSGSVVVFPDDDCWYPRGFLSAGLDLMRTREADILSGRAADETGRDINGRFEKKGCRIDRTNVWTTGIEWVVFFTRGALDKVGAYDPHIGIGASTPWQACEGQDIMLRALAKGLRCYYEPTLIGHHEEHVVSSADAALCRKARAYGRGLGHVLRAHDYSSLDAALWIGRASLRAVQALATGKIDRFNYYRSVALGRSEGWFDSSLAGH